MSAKRKGKSGGARRPTAAMNRFQVYGVPVQAAHLAVLAGQPGATSFNASELRYHGTAFAVAAGLFLTAGHVLEEAERVGTIALGLLTPERIEIHQVTEHEILRAIDVGIARCPIPATVLACGFRTLSFAEPVAVAGWTLGPDPEYLVVMPRVFAGSIVTRRRMFRVGGRVLTSQPAGYELSFGVPGGLSGAPLISGVDGKVAGIAVGTMTHAEDQVMKQLGIAIDIIELLRLDSQKFGPVATIFGREALPACERVRKVVIGPDGKAHYEDEPTLDLEGWPEM
jgi:hypothetical protein